MKKITAAFALCLLLAVGSCNDTKTAIEDAGKGVTDTLQNSKDAGAAASLKNFESAIAAFKAANGKFPADLKELSDFSGTAASPDVYNYDPETGKITLKKG
jgi:hypothetical protein